MTDTVNVIEKKRKFDIKKGVNLPHRISTHKVGDSYLFVAPEKFSFITTNEMGYKFLNMFKKGDSIEEIIEKLKKSGYLMDTIHSELHSFLVKVESKSFYEDSKTTEIETKEQVLHLDITSKCNLTCVHCLRNAGKEQINELTTSEWLNIIEIFSSLYKTRVCISGGEALLHPGIFDILERAKNSGLHVSLFTNGTLIDKNVIERIQPFVDKIQLSLDGATKEVNDEIRGKNCFSKVMQAIKLLKETPIHIDLAISLMPQNARDLENNIEILIKSLGPEVNLRISPTMAMGRADKSHIFPSDEIASTELWNLMKDIYQKRLKSLSPNTKNIKVKNCGYGETIVISETGDVFPCNYRAKKSIYGNIREKNLVEIMKIINKDRELVSVENIADCKKCDLNFLCSGGCRLNNLFKNNDLLKVTCTTEFKRKLWATIVEKEEKFDPLTLWWNGHKKIN